MPVRAPLLICLEGPDGSGKTTLANAIIAEAKKKNLSVHYEHCGYTKFKDRINAYHTAALWRCLKSGAGLAILDRWWMSEEIYGQVYRGGTPWPQSGRFLDRVFSRFSGLYVICAPKDPQVAYERAKGRKSDELYWEKNKTICELYHELIPVENVEFKYRKEDYGSVFRNGDVESVLHYDRDKHRAEDYARYVIDEARDLRDRSLDSVNQLLDPHFFNFAGDPNAKVAFVGDRTNSKLRDRRLSWPFFEHANCSLYLAKALQLAGIGEGETMWFNSGGSGAEYNLFFAKSRKCRIVALGSLAAEWLEDNDTPSYHRIPHPQYARRFQHHDLYGYACLLAEGMQREGPSIDEA